LTPVIINEGVFVQYKWQQPDKTELSCSDCENISIIPPGNAHYSLIVVNEFGCSDTAEISFHTRRSLYFPNAFSPNQDGVNDYFFPLGKGISMMTFKVYNRWGGVVYDFDGAYPPDPLAFGWKGDANGQMMPTDVYTWSCQLSFIDGSLSHYQGQVTLLR
jgi:gliding motility-associated-like protein